MEPHTLELSCHEVQAMMSHAAPPTLIDCREAQEHALVALPGSTLIPMSEFPNRVGEIEHLRDEPVVVYCHHGMRSAQVAAWLRDQGFQRVSSMAGGIDRWAATLDPDMARY